MIGARVGNWYLESELGRGALGSVYRARGFDTSDDAPQVAAVKVLTAAATQDPTFLQRFTGEMLGLQRLDHVNIARFYDSGTHGGLAFFACELIDGDDFGKLLEGGRRPWREVLSVAVQLARALKHGHNRNLLHRDLKPAHVMLTTDGTVKVLAFGVAKVVLPPPPSAAPVLGSAAYLPPETASGKPPTRRSDFYSLGGVLYTLLTGRPPFAAATAVELIHKQCYALPERPALLVPDLPPEVDEFVCTLLDKTPSRRPGTAAAVLDELERIRGKLERKGETLVWPAKLQPDTAETPTLAAALGMANGPASAGGDSDGDPRPLMKRPLVVVPLFLLALGTLVAAFAWPRPTAADLHAAALPLMASDDPADWERAWDQYLYPLSQKYPGRYDEDVSRARQKVHDRRELRRVLAEGAKVDPRTDAERFYLRGLRLAQAGDIDAARAVWKAVLDGFAGVQGEERWVDLSSAGLSALRKSPGNRASSDRTSLEAALAWAKGCPPGQRDAALSALEELYRDDPAALAAVRAAKPK